MAAEPDEVTSAVIGYPGGTETAVLRGGGLAAGVGQGRYELKQTTARGVHRGRSVWGLRSFQARQLPGAALQ